MRVSAIAIFVACSRTPVEETNTYVLDFSKSSDSRGLFLSALTHLEFSIDVDHPVRTYALSSLSTNVERDFIQTEDLLSCPHIPLSLDSFAHVEAGTPAHVTSVDVVISDNDVMPRTWDKTGVCFAYRTPDGAWRTETLATATPVVRDDSTGQFRVHLSIDKGPIDALTLWFTTGTQPHAPLQSIAYTVQP